MARTIRQGYQWLHGYPCGYPYGRITDLSIRVTSKKYKNNKNRNSNDLRQVGILSFHIYLKWYFFKWFKTHKLSFSDCTNTHTPHVP